MIITARWHKGLLIYCSFFKIKKYIGKNRHNAPATPEATKTEIIPPPSMRVATTPANTPARGKEIRVDASAVRSPPRKNF